MAMNPRLLRPRASGSALHPDALDWITRVTNNGGSASSNTLAAVSKFCADIEAAGLRSKFYRLNLFCGTGLNAVLVPLYLNTSRAGSALGNTTDTNNNFVSGDYVELGSATGGLKGNGSNKDLQTGVNPVSLSFGADDHHISVYVKGTEAAGTSRYMLSNTSGGSGGSGIGWLNGGTTERFHGPAALLNPSGTSEGLLTGNVFGGEYNYYRASTSAATSVSSGGTYGNSEYRVFSGNGFLFSLARYFRAYSIGLGFSQAQVTAYYNAMQAFQTALDRQV